MRPPPFTSKGGRQASAKFWRRFPWVILSAVAGYAALITYRYLEMIA